MPFCPVLGRSLRVGCFGPNDAYTSRCLARKRTQNSSNAGWRRFISAQLTRDQFGLGVPQNVLVAERNALLRCATPLWLSEEQRAAIKRKYPRARALSAATGERWHVDHIIPFQGEKVSGLHVPWNLRVVKGKCNLRKHAIHDPDAHEHKLPRAACAEPKR